MPAYDMEPSSTSTSGAWRRLTGAESAAAANCSTTFDGAPAKCHGGMESDCRNPVQGTPLWRHFPLEAGPYQKRLFLGSTRKFVLLVKTSQFAPVNAICNFLQSNNQLYLPIHKPFICATHCCQQDIQS